MMATAVTDEDGDNHDHVRMRREEHEEDERMEVRRGRPLKVPESSGSHRCRSTIFSLVAVNHDEDDTANCDE